MKKRFGLFIVDDFACVCIGGAFTMLCILTLILGGIALSGCTTPEDDVPLEGIDREWSIEDLHGDYVDGTMYFPIRAIFVNSDEGSWDLQGYLDRLNEVFSAIDVQFYVARFALMRVTNPARMEDNLSRQVYNRDYINLYMSPAIELIFMNGSKAQGYASSNVSVGTVTISIAMYSGEEEDVNVVFAHEFAHIFGLGHVYGDPNYPDNYMGTGSRDDMHFEEDQLEAMRRTALAARIKKGAKP